MGDFNSVGVWGREVFGLNFRIWEKWRRGGFSVVGSKADLELSVSTAC